MISGDFKHCTTLSEFYDEIVQLHKQHHGDHYCDVHDEIREAVHEKRYMELGVNQGATLAAACLVGLESCQGWDINIDRFEPQRRLFNDLDFRFSAAKGNSLTVKRQLCDVLYIDTLHVKTQLAKELSYWSPFVRETIICHDTASKPELQAVCQQFVELNKKDWYIKKYNTQSVGYTVLEKKE